jgi:hypothetical protein
MSEKPKRLRVRSREEEVDVATQFLGFLVRNKEELQGYIEHIYAKWSDHMGLRGRDKNRVWERVRRLRG